MKGRTLGFNTICMLDSANSKRLDFSQCLRFRREESAQVGAPIMAVAPLTRSYHLYGILIGNGADCIMAFCGILHDVVTSP